MLPSVNALSSEPGEECSATLSSVAVIVILKSTVIPIRVIVPSRILHASPYVIDSGSLQRPEALTLPFLANRQGRRLASTYFTRRE